MALATCLFYREGKLTSLPIELREDLLSYIPSLLVQALRSLNPFKGLFPFIYEGKDESILKQRKSILSLGLLSEIEDEALPSALLLSQDLLDRWKRFITQRSFTSPSSLSKVVTCSVMVGRSSLSAHKWQSLNVGDVLLLPESTFSLQEQRGNLGLSVGGKQLAQLRLVGTECTFSHYQSSE